MCQFSKSERLGHSDPFQADDQIDANNLRLSYNTYIYIYTHIYKYIYIYCECEQIFPLDHTLS